MYCGKVDLVDDFERELKVGFLDEAAQALSDVEQAFLALESDPNNQSTIDQIFRLAHNLKGSSKAVGFEEMGAFTHEFESLLLKIKNKDIVANSAVVNLLLRCTDHLNLMIGELKQNLDASVDSKSLISELQNVDSILADSESVASFEIDNEISAADLQVFQQISESDPFGSKSDDEVAVASRAPLQNVSIPTVQQELDKKPVQSSASQNSNSDESIRISLKKLERLIEYVGEMAILQAVLKEQSLDERNQLTRKTIHQLGKVGKEIQDISMSLRMVPIKPTFQKMQRIVRDTAMSLGKDIKFETIGEETELDKTVLERINDPLVHLVRNSVDHGIEDAQRRLQVGKPSQGKVILSASQEAGKLVIRIVDDGGGIDPQKLRKVAESKGIVKSSAVLTDKECINLIFAPGFSTKEQVTDVSGRGVGMDVVKTNIKDLGGEIDIETNIGKGTTFKISLPLTLAIIDGMAVKCGDEKFILPLSHVHESVKPSIDDIKHTTGVGPMLLLRGETLPIFRLSGLFNRKSNLADHDSIAVVIRTGNMPFAMLVDDIIGQFQVVTKQLSPELQHLKGVTGTTILGDGKPALIVEPAELVRSAA